MSSPKDIGVGIVGTGFAATSHVDALRRVPGVRIAGVAGSSRTKAEAFAAAQGLERGFDDLDALLADPAVEAVHDCTPNDLHAAVNAAALDAGKHLLSEKPLALDGLETAQLVEHAGRAGVVTGVCFNYRHFPLVQEARIRLASGELGAPHAIRGGYLQDWLLYEDDWNWRLVSSRAGSTRAVGDIGSHWIDLAQHVTGDRLARVFARLGTLHGVRRRPGGEVETFARASSAAAEEIAVDTEDMGTVLFETEGGCAGAFHVSQVSPGRRNRLTLEIDTPARSIAWDQEEPNRLWLGRRDGPNEVLVRDPALLAPAAAPLAHYPAGHEEGWPDGLRNLVADFYGAVRAAREGREHAGTFATFAEAHRVMRTVEAILESHRSRAWAEVREQVEAPA